MSTRGIYNEEEEAKFSKGNEDVDFDFAYTAPQNFVARTDFKIKLSDFETTFRGFHFSDIELLTDIFLRLDTHGQDHVSFKVIIYK
jgi:hypothetical protein